MDKSIDNFDDSLSLNEACERIENMDIRGAGRIARAVAVALKNHTAAFKGDSVRALSEHVRSGARKLLATRPTAVSLANALRYIVRGMDAMDAISVDEMRAKVMDLADGFHQRSLKAMDTIADIGAERIRDGDTILTHCNSTTALGIILKAHSEGKNIRVIATESRPRHQGYITSSALAEAGVPVELIVDSAVRYFMPEVDIVIMGADTISANGSVVNKIGTSQVALIAHEARVPVIIAAETYKFSPETLLGRLVEIEEREPQEVVDTRKLPGVRIRNPAFDATPKEYIDAVVTEVGMIPPTAAYNVIVEQFGPTIPIQQLLKEGE